MNKYKVILINLNSIPNLDFSPVFPIGAVYVKSFLKQIGVQVKFVDFNQHPDWFKSYHYLNDDFDCIAFSLRNVDSMELNSAFLLPYYKKVMEDIVKHAKNKNPNAFVLLGGGGYSVYSDGLDGYLPFDQGIKGNVEEDLFEVIKEHSLTLDRSINLKDDFSMFDIDFENDLVETYVKLGAPQIGLPTRCGGRCPMKCVYCSYGKIDNKTNLTRPLENLQNDILKLYQMGVREIFFTDSLFNISLSHAKKICEMISGLKLDGLQWSAYAKPTIDEEFIQMASNSGCKNLMVSFDTFSPKMLIELKKGFNKNQAITFIELCKKMNINLTALLLFGGPLENEETIKETCDVVNNYFYPGELFFSFGMRLLPGSRLAELSGISEKEMVRPMFWPFDEKCFDLVINSLDTRFLRFNVLARISGWRRAYLEMKTEKIGISKNPVLVRKVEL